MGNGTVFIDEHDLLEMRDCFAVPTQCR
jgi:hypothetical protein